MALSLGHLPMFGAIGASDTKIGPIMPRVGHMVAVEVEQPLSIRGPDGSEIEMRRIGGDDLSVRAIEVANHDFITPNACCVKSNSGRVGAEADPIRKPFALMRDLARV